MFRFFKKVIQLLPRKSILFSFGIFFLALYFVLNHVADHRVFAAINPQINYQGKLTDTNNVAVADGNYIMKFRLYTSATGATTTNIWEEIRTETGDRATVSNGLFSVLLGSSTPFTGVNFNQTLYLGVEVCGTVGLSGCDGEMSPRKKLGAVPASFETEKIDGLSSEQFFRNDATNATSSATTSLSVVQNGAGKIAEFFGPNSVSALSILSNGNVGIGTTSPFTRLSVVGEILSSYFTATSTATSTFAGSIAVTEVNATSTFAGGIDLSDGCFAVDGVCVTSGLSAAITAIGPTGQTQTGATQTLATSTNGTDFTITASGDTQTFNLPFASATAHGKLRSTDWTIFNNKISSTSIDTSAEFFALVTDETGGSGVLVGSVSPALTGTPTMTGFISTASSTIGGGTITSGLTISGAATTSQHLIVQGSATSTFTGGVSASRLNTSATSTFAGVIVGSQGLQVSTLPSCSQALETDASGNVICGTDSTGITAIGPLGQTQTGATQTLATSTNGTDFTITASGDTQTFNLPFASLSAHGKLSSADWTIFNNKISSTSIDTSAELFALVTDETGGTGVLVGSVSPALTGTPTMTGFISTASSTIGGGTITTGLTISGAATTSQHLIVQGTATSTFTGGISSSRLNTSATSTLTGVVIPSQGLQIGTIVSCSQALETDSSGNVICGTDSAGITAIGPTGQTQTGATQTLATSTNGTDFTITASGDTQTFNLPFASATAHGKLSTSDWTIFNNKISSTSIDTLAELETLQGGINILAETEIDACSELLALIDDETGTCGGLVFSTLPTLQGFISTASSTIGGGTIISGLTISGAATTSQHLIVQGTATSTFTGGISSSRLNTSATSTLAGVVIGTQGLQVSTLPSCTQALETDASGNVVCGTDSTGITALGPTGQTQTGATQTLATSTNGTDFTITASGDTQTFNLPFASATAHGKLRSTDWTIFNNKISSTSIDTLAELETLQGGINILAETEIDACSELLALIDDETGTCGALVFSTLPTLQGFISNASSTIGGGTITTGLTISGAATTSQHLIVQGTATSTFAGGISASRLNTSATSTLAGLIIGTQGLQVSTLPSCTQALETDSNGTVVCGTDATGITTIGPTGQGQTGTTQTLATSTNGTDFTITASGDTQTFNLPFASATAHGKLRSTDWTIFNNKISSTSIDTLAELETLQGGINILAETEIDACSELLALIDDETGTCGGLVFSTLPTLQGFISTASSTIGGSGITSGLTIAGAATTSQHLIVQGTGTSTFAGSIAVTETNATSTFAGGVDLSNGCFAINGACLASGGSGTVGSGVTGQFPYYAANGTTLTATSSIFLASNQSVGIGTTTPSAQLEVSGNTILGLNETTDGSFIVTTGEGATIIGNVESLATISSTGDGSLAGGHATSENASIVSQGAGSFAFGHTETAGVVSSSANGAFGIGFAQNSGSISAQGNGSLAGGLADANTIQTSGIGAFAWGYANNGNVFALGDASLAFGDNITASEALSFAFGSGYDNNIANSFMVGFSATPTLSVENLKVGIGSTSPFATLAVGKEVKAGFFTATSTTATSTISSGGFSAGTITGGSGIVVQQNSGRILIGTSTTVATSYPFTLQAGSGDGFVGSMIASSGSRPAFLAFENVADANDGWAFGRSGTGEFNIAYSSAYPFVQSFMPFSILQSGNVGIGTTSPFEKLAVTGTVVANTFNATSTATSTFAGSIAVTESNATSTFAGGIDLSNGCFAISGTCLAGVGGSGDITSVGDVTSGAAFDGTQGTTLTFNDADGDQTLSYDTTNNKFVFSAGVSLGAAGVNMVGSDGLLSLTGLGDGNDENLIFDFDNAAANSIMLFSASGVNLLNFGSIGLSSYASSTIGAGTQATGLTVSGGATTTSNLTVLGTGVSSIAGTVGIGDTTPGAALDVRDTTGAVGNTDILKIRGISANTNPVLVFSNGASGGAGVNILRMGTAGTTGNSTINSFGYLAFGTNSATLGSNERMRIAADGNVGIGTTTPWGTLSVVANSNTIPQFVIATSSGRIPLFYVSATSTGDLDWARIAIGTTTNPFVGTAGLRDQFVVAGRIYTTWRYLSCDVGGSSIGGISVTADASGACGDFGFDEDTDMDIVPNAGGTIPFARLRAGPSVLAGDGGALRAASTIGSASSSPVFEMLGRHFSGMASTTRIFIGFTDFAGASDYGVVAPTNGIYFSATSTGNWQAIVRKDNSEFRVDTGVASTSATLPFQRFRIEVSSSTVTFLIDGDVKAVITSADTPNIPNANISPMVALAVSTTATIVGVTREFDVSFIRVWVDDPPIGITTGDNSPTVIEELPHDHITGADISEAYLLNDPIDLSPGTVMSVDENGGAKIKKTVEPYDSALLGVIATSPHHVLGNETNETVRIAVAGRVPVTVSPENGNIKVGDYLTSSSLSGVAMKATRSGAVLGRALENFSGTATGTVLISVEPGQYNGTYFAVDEEGSIGARGLVIEGNAESMTEIQYLGDAEYQSFSDKIRNVNLATYKYAMGSTTSSQRLGIIPGTAPSEILSVDGQGIDVYKLASFTLGGLKAQQLRLDTIETRLSQLEALMGTTTLGSLGTSTIASASTSVSFGGILSYLESLGIKIVEGLTTIKNLVAEKFTVGTPEKPTGITIYDKETGEPYCIEVIDGDFETTPGECTVGDLTPPENEGDSGDENEVSEHHEPTPEPADLSTGETPDPNSIPVDEAPIDEVEEGEEQELVEPTPDESIEGDEEVRDEASESGSDEEEAESEEDSEDESEESPSAEE